MFPHCSIFACSHVGFLATTVFKIVLHVSFRLSVLMRNTRPQFLRKNRKSRNGSCLLSNYHLGKHCSFRAKDQSVNLKNLQKHIQYLLKLSCFDSTPGARQSFILLPDPGDALIKHRSARFKGWRLKFLDHDYQTASVSRYNKIAKYSHKP